ncbi:hypothetical protein G6F63_014601 [Rhizopus arrhizus]|nr:hypothetical protein G6F63_014601 [Rhizopus arrhizus]
MQARAGALRGKAVQHGQPPRPRTEVADPPMQVAFLAHRQLRGVCAQAFQFAQQALRAAVEGLPRRRQPHAIAAAIQQGQIQLAFQLGHGCKHRGVRTMQRDGSGLEAARTRHGVEALQVVQGEVAHAYL